MQKTAQKYTIQVGTMHYRELNGIIHERMARGVRRFVLLGVTGQRYIGAGLPHGIEIVIYGVPGQDLGVFNTGARIVVRGNAQDGVGNTMNEGLIEVHGSVGDIPGHMMREGKIFIRGHAGFRAGIMMKEFGDKRPVMIVGETIGDYVGEYMAGGTIVVLGIGLAKGQSPVARHVASGMFGGRIFIRGKVVSDQVGNGAVLQKADREAIEALLPCLEEYAGVFDIDPGIIAEGPYYIISRAGGRPYGNLYVPSNKVGRDLVPVHKNLAPPCAAACPAGIPNPVIIRHLREGRTREAFELIDDYTPFRYSCCGMVCPGLCKAACTRGGLGSAVKIDEISRQYAPSGPTTVSKKKRPQKVAVIGAGPSGLSAAWQLTRRGYMVDMWEKEEDIGGKLTHHIPEQRLPRASVERDLERIRSIGIQFHTGITVDNERFETMKNEYDAVVIATGASKPRRVGFAGEERAVAAYDFLKSLKKKRCSLDLDGKRVAIIGAGNVAMDTACESFRLGAASVVAVDIARPMAFGKELDHALSLGTRILFPRLVERYEKDTLVFKNGESIDADFVVVAVGETPLLEFVGEEIVSEKDSFATNIPGVFIVGDAVSPGLITHSIGMGRRFAEILDRMFRGVPSKEEDAAVQSVAVDKRRINTIYFQETDTRGGTLDECFSCGTCIQCDICVEACPRQAITRSGEQFSVDEDHCTGCGICASVCPRGAITMTIKYSH
jgi:putative selenate reductase